MKLKIVLIGAGSREFGPATIRDILLSDLLCQRDLEVALMDVSAESLPPVLRYAEAIRERLGRRCQLTCSTDLNAAVAGADSVVTAIEIRRYFYWAQDFHVPRKHGFRQIYGENGGPGGLFHALRNMGPMLEVARAMEKHCPEAWLLNYTNPLTKLCEALTQLTAIRTVGLCHGVFQGMEQVARILGKPTEELDTAASGLNHCTWFQEIRSRTTGEDLYPLLRQRERQADWLAEWDEIALSRTLLRIYGLYPSPGANHIGEYIRWAEEFLASSALQFFYDPAEGQPWETGEVPSWIYNLHENAVDRPLFGRQVDAAAADALDASATLAPSGELAVPLMEGVFCGERRPLAAVNVPNRGAVPGLPDGSVVEVPAVADGSGLHPRKMPPLPEGVRALLRTQTSIHALLVRAYQLRSRKELLRALLLDPTTQSYRSAVHLVNEMCALQAAVLPPLEW